jgi:hypothetical protein
MAYAEPIRPVIAGRCFGGADTPIMIYEPPKVPATPKPVTALPTTSVVLFCATPNIIVRVIQAVDTNMNVKLTANQATNLKYCYAEKIHGFYREVLESLTPNRL